MPKFRVHIQPVVVEACSKIEAMAKALHFVDDNPSFLMAEPAGPEEPLARPDDGNPLFPRRA